MPQIIDGGLVKNFLHAWCGKHNLGDYPIYTSLPSSSPPGLFAFQASIGKTGKIPLGGIVGVAQAGTKRTAKTEAAISLCTELIKAGYMTQSEFDSKKPNPRTNKSAILLKNGINGKIQKYVENGIDSGKSTDSKPKTETEPSTSTYEPAPAEADVPKIDQVISNNNPNDAKMTTESHPVIDLRSPEAKPDQTVDFASLPSTRSYLEAGRKRKPLTDTVPHITGFVDSTRKVLLETPPASKKLRLSPPSKERDQESDNDIQFIEEVKKVSDQNDGGKPGSSDVAGNGNDDGCRLSSSANEGSPPEENNAEESRKSHDQSSSSGECSSDESEISVNEPEAESNSIPVPATINLMTSTGPVAFKDKDATWQRVSADILEHYFRNRQSREVFAWKMEIIKSVTAVLNHYIRVPYHLFPVGSTINGLGSYNCDMDLCLVMFGFDRYGREIVNDDQNSAKRILYAARAALEYLPNIENLHVIPATVPIVRFGYRDNYNAVEVDINCNNLPGIRNSHLMHYYSLVDDRFPALALLIKHWGIVAGVNDAAAGTLSSYAVVLMVIHYLQYGVTQVFQNAKPILPNLQALFPLFFTPGSDVRALELDKKLRFPPNQEALMDRETTLAELLLGFFNYYANHFNFATSVVSIREGKPLKRNLAMHRTKLIWVEEPFEGTNVARAVCLQQKYERIVQAFHIGYKSLRRGRSLKSIGVTLL